MGEHATGGCVNGSVNAVRILLVTPVVPYPANTGGRQRTNLLHRALSELGHVDTFLIAGEPDLKEEHWRTLAAEFNLIGACPPQQTSEIGWPKYLRPLHPTVVNRSVNVLLPDRQFVLAHPNLQEALLAAGPLSRYDIIVGRYLSSLVHSGVLGQHRVAVDMDDLGTTMLDSRLAAGSDSFVRRQYLRRVRGRLAMIERRQLEQCAHVWVAKEGDAARVTSENCSILRNIPFSPAGHCEAFNVDMPMARQSQTLLTVGVLNYGPNVVGIDAFLQDVWPEIRRRVPAAAYRIVGSRLDAATAARWKRHDGVTVVGFAEDLQAEYLAAAAAICPIPWGGGTNIKVAESLAFARPAIVSEPAYRGWENVFPEGATLFVARSVDEFIQHTTTLLKDPRRREIMGAAGRLAVKEHLSFDVFRKTVAAGVRSALSAPRP